MSSVTSTAMTCQPGPWRERRAVRLLALALAPVLWVGVTIEALPTAPGAVVGVQAQADARQAELLRYRFESLQARAQSGHADAAYELGQAYINGWGTEVNIAEGVRWLTVAADAGHVDSDYRLGHLFESGALGEPDPVRALHHYRRAGDAGHAASNYWLGLQYMARDERGQARDLQQGLDRLQRAAEAGDVNAAYYLGMLLNGGAAGANQGARAMSLIRQAAEGGQRDAQRVYAYALLEGRAVPVDTVAAHAWFRRAGDAEGERLAWSRMSAAERTRAEAQIADAR